MLRIIQKNNAIKARKLKHSDNVFHEALSYVKENEKYFHVSNDSGINYDLEYKNNNGILSEVIAGGHIYFSEYLNYDENRTSDLYLEGMDLRKNICFEELNEYAVVLTKILLMHTDKIVYHKDQNITYFVGDCERIVIGEAPSDDTFYISENNPGNEHVTSNANNVLVVFNYLFCLQAFAKNKPLKELDNIVLKFDKEAGIGSIIRLYYTFKSAFRKKGVSLLLDVNSTRYNKSIWKKYTCVDVYDGGLLEGTSEMIDNHYLCFKTKAITKEINSIDYSFFNQDFLKEIETYRIALFKDKKVIGVLLRGTDYITSGLDGERSPLRQAPIEKVIIKLKEMIETKGYDTIFLATEDRDILSRMGKEFKNKLIALSQIRHSVNDFITELYLDEVDRNSLSSKEYEENLDDTTANYLYAIYILSKCDSYVCAGITSAYPIITALNNSAFIENIIVR